MILMEKKSQRVTFLFRSPQKTQKVYICGDFNKWKEPGLPMEKIKANEWKATLVLSPGQYRYKYLVDGFYCNDKEAENYLPNAWGSEDSVVSVED